MSIAWSFPRGYRNKKGMKVGGLGPGAYDPKIHPYSETPKWSMRGRYNSKNKKYKGPGPGKYTHKLKSDGPKFSIRTKTKLPRNQNQYNPGPGTYSTKKQNSRPKYSIRKKPKQIGSKSICPGPGTYEDINSNTYKTKNPKWTMRGKQSNSKKTKKSRNPGPGAYPVSSSLNKKSTKFGTSMRSKLVKKGGPAPWNYDIKGSSEINLLNKKGKSIGQKLASRKRETGPDPGIYDPNVNFSKTSAPSYGFGFEKRGELADNKVGPPPNSYNPSFSLTKPAGPNWGLGSGKQRAAIKDKGVPGPGNYDSRTKGTSGPQYSIGAKFNDNQKESKPGPGNYNPKLDGIDPNKKAPGFSKGKQRTDLLKQDGNPGPGHYPNPSTLKGKGTKFGSDNRNAFKSKKGPGPGTYAYQGDIDTGVSKKKGPSIGMRTNPLSKDKTPAPGIYDPNINLTKPQAPGWKMGTGTRTDPKNDKTLDPGAYNPKLNLVKQAGPNWGMGTAQRGNLAMRNENPAPGNYKVRKEINDGPLFSIGMKANHKIKNVNPGPGTHNPNVNFVKPSNSGPKIGSETLSKQVISNDPGPGHYPTKTTLKMKGTKFGNENRKAFKEKNGPGPGIYKISGDIDINLAKNKGPSFGSRQPQIDHMVTPSPGNYDPQFNLSKPNAPGWKMGSGARNGPKLDQKQDPGQYNPNFDPIKQKGPNWSMGTAQRTELGVKTFTPGPGIYNVRKNKNSSLQYTMGARTGSQHHNLNPGPGTHDPSITLVKPSNKGPKFGTEPIDKVVDKRQVPGPGHYPNPTTLKGKGTKFGVDTRGKSKSKKGPGPGNYNIKGDIDMNLDKNKGPSLGARTNIRGKDETPAPGIYDPNLKITKPQAPGWKMGTGERVEIKKDTVPDAGAYNPSITQTKHSGPNWGIGTSQRTNMNVKNEVPGPGVYQVRGQAQGPKYSLRQKPQGPVDKNNYPEPGTYNPNINNVKYNYGSAKFGSEPIGKTLDKRETPGPGHYPNPSTLKGKGTKFGSDNRNAFTSKKGPGPGTYAYQGDIDTGVSKKKGPSIGMRTNPLSKDKTPAPGIYDPNINLTKPQAPGWKMGTGTRTDPKNDKTLDPGAYNPNLNLVKQAGPNWGMGTAQRGNLAMRNGNPAPGNYKVRKEINDGPLFSMGQRIDHQIYSTVPGPGTHNPDIVLVKPKKIGTKFGKEKQRISKNTKNTPGPGHYPNPSGLHKNGPKFGSQMRTALASKSGAPGPGNYKLTSSFDPSHKKGPIIGQKLPKKQKTDKVSPGLYDPKVNLTKPSIKGGRMGIKTKGALDIKNANPAPGHYNPELGTSMPEWKFGSGKQRASSLKKKAPGPGTYGYDNPYSLKKKPKFAMGVKLSKKKKKKNPGPGAYDPRSNLVKESKSKGGKISIGKSRRVKGNRKSKDPGPGQYDVRYKYGKHGYKFGTGGRHWMSRSQGPGPGTYNLIPAFANVPAYNR